MLNQRLHSKAFEYLIRLQAGSPRHTKRNIEEKMMAILSFPEEKWEEGARENGIIYNPQVHRMLKMLKEEGLDKIYDEHKDGVPRLQSIIDFSIMEETKSGFDRIIQEQFNNAESYNVSDKVFFGTADSNIATAYIQKVPDSDEFLIVINRQLWELAKLVSYMLTIILFNEKGMPRSFNPENAESYLRYFLVNAASILNDSGLQKELQPVALEKGTMPELIWLKLDGSLHDFIIGHEYGHFLKSHFTNECTYKTETLNGTDVKLNLTSWNNEYDADRTGLDLTVFRARGASASEIKEMDDSAKSVAAFNMTLGYLGSWACLHLIWNIEQIWEVVYKPDAGHPPTPLRIASMNSVIFQQMPDKASADYAGQLLWNTASCIKYLFYKIQPDTAKETPRVKDIEARFQHFVLQAVLFYKHRDVVDDLESMQSRFEPPFFAPDNIKAIHEKELMKKAYALLEHTLMTQTIPWQECTAIIERTILILKKNAAIFNL